MYDPTCTNRWNKGAWGIEATTKNRDNRSLINKSIPIVSIVVPFGFTNFIFRILTGSPKKGTTMETIGRSLLNPKP